MNMVRAEMICKNTGCLFLGGVCVPFYCLSEREWILLDCGSHFDRERLMAYLSEKKIQVRGVLCSHAHYDHVENNRCMQETYGARIVMTAFDAGMVHDALSLKSCFYSHTPTDNELFCGDMICRADQILPPDVKEAEVCGVNFEMLPLPGHAASHFGIVTPDKVMYLADSLFTPSVLEKEKLFYMLSWTQALETMKELEQLPYHQYILAHQGISYEVKELARDNRQHLLKNLEELLDLCAGESTLEELTRRLAKAKGTSIRSIEKARFMERLVRSMAEYWLEKGTLEIRLREGIPVYIRSR